MAGNDGGRPTVMTDDVLRKLEDAFLRGLSDRQACLYAGIAASVLYEYQKERPEFSERKTLLKENVKMRARLNVHNAIDNGDIDASWRYLERKDESFKPTTKTEHAGGLTLTGIFQRAKAQADESAQGASHDGDA